MFLNQYKRTNQYILLCIIVYPWLFHVFQGIYIAELGYWLVSYEHFFNAPEVAQTTFYSWLTTFIGAILNYFIGSFGIIGFKIANVFVIYLILYTVYKLLHNLITTSYLLFFILATEVLIHSYYFINYYTLTTLFFTTATLFLYKGLTKNKLSYIFISGIFLSLNIFIRFPNILGIGFIVAILYYQMMKTPREYKLITTQISTFLLGYTLTIIFTLITMEAFGHLEYYIQNIKEILYLANGSSSHGSNTILIAYFTEQFFAILESLKLFFIFTFTLILIEFYRKWPLKIYLLGLFLVTLGTYYLLLVSHTGHTNYMYFYNGIIGFTYTILIWIVLFEMKKNINIGLISMLTFISIQIIPFGSATVLHQAKFGLYLALPFIFTYIMQKKTLLSYKSYKIHPYSVKIFLLILALILITYSIITVTIFHPPGLEEKRWKMIYTVNDKHLQYNYMSKEKAQTLQQLLDNIHLYSENLTYILSYEGISTVSYLSDLEPYLKTTYPFFMTLDDFIKELEYQERHKDLPMVVRAKSDVSIKGWPSVTVKIGPYSGSINTTKIRSTLETFLLENNYTTAWENNEFEILIPSTSHTNNHILKGS